MQTDSSIELQPQGDLVSLRVKISSESEKGEPIEAKLECKSCECSSGKKFFSYFSKRNICLGFTFGALIVDPLFGAFVGVAIYKTFIYFLELAGINNLGWQIFSGFSSVILSVMLEIGEQLAVHPILEAEDFLTKTSIKIDQTGWKFRFIIVMIIFNQLIANFSYFFGSGSDAVTVSYLTSSEAPRWLFGIILTILGMVYYNMLTAVKIVQHTIELFRRLLLAPFTFLINILKSPLRSLEVSVQSLFNAANRAVFFGYITHELLSELFDEKQNSVVNFYCVLSVGIATFWTSLFSRTLNVHEVFFNKKFEKLTADDKKGIEIPRSQTVLDSFMMLFRGMPVSVLTFTYSSIENTAGNVLLSLLIGSLVFAQGFYVRQQNYLNKVAAANKSYLLTEEEKNEANEADHFKQQTAQYKTARLEKFIDICNKGGRIATGIAFYGFLVTLNDLIKTHQGNDFSPLSLFCIHQLWVNPSLENDYSFYKDAMLKHACDWKARYLLWKSKKPEAQPSLPVEIPSPLVLV